MYKQTHGWIVADQTKAKLSPEETIILARADVARLTVAKERAEQHLQDLLAASRAQRAQSM